MQAGGELAAATRALREDVRRDAAAFSERLPLAAEAGLERLKAMLEAAFDLGTYQVQVDLASSEALRDAQARPEHQADLFARVGGHLVPFTLLPSKAQADVMARTELEL